MQIRLATRQDEPEIKNLVDQAYAKSAVSPVADLKTDLNNIEASYFYDNGVCLVAEEDGKILGVAAACQENENDLLLTRLALLPDARHRGITTRLLQTLLFFAANSEYKNIVYYKNRAGVEEKQARERFVPEEQNSQRLVMAVPEASVFRHHQAQ